MPVSNTSRHYGSVTKVFHWLTALLIFAVIPLGLIASRLPLGSEAEIGRVFTLFSLHKTIGITIFFVALARILWAITQTKPGGLHPERRAETMLAETIHWLLYASLVIAPLTGWIHHAALDGFAPIWWPFGQDLPLVPKDERIAHLFGSFHWIFTKVMAASIMLHVAGALKHHVIDKDVTLRRMWFGKTDVPDIPAHRSPVAAPILAATVFIATGALASTWHAPTTALLADVASDWQVQDGKVAIGVTQFGNKVEGEFTDWTADITFDPDGGPDYGRVSAKIAIGSLTLGTLSSQALGADFFDAAAFPTATFDADIVDGDDGNYLADGILTIKGNSVPTILDFTMTITDQTAVMAGDVFVQRSSFAIGESTDENTLGPQVSIQINVTAQRE